MEKGIGFKDLIAQKELLFDKPEGATVAQFVLRLGNAPSLFQNQSEY